MTRIGFTFKIKPEFKDEYKKAHDEIWPEQVKALRDSGFKNYASFFSKDGTIFNYLETDDFEKTLNNLSKMESNTRWQKFMDKYFVKEDNSKVGPDIIMLEEVYHL